MTVALALMKARDQLKTGKTPDELRKTGVERRAAAWAHESERRRLRKHPRHSDEVYVDPSALRSVRPLVVA